MAVARKAEALLTGRFSPDPYLAVSQIDSVRAG
jgi:hypothetical protein